MSPSELESILQKGRLSENEPMSLHTTFRAGGPARFYAVPYDENELAALLKLLRKDSFPYFVTGNGSNLLVSDRGFEGVVINIGKNEENAFQELSLSEEEDEDGLIIAGAGCLMTSVGKFALRNSLTGFEPLSGIPGCVGGACIMNAGAYGGEIKDVIQKVRAILPDGSVKTYEPWEMKFRYRGSSLADDGAVITKAYFRLKKGESTEIRAAMEDFTGRRKEKQPLEFPSAGSTFKRPEGYFAGKLIEDAGLKGRRIGGASVSKKHAGFVINDQGGSAADIYHLIRLIQETVYEKYGVSLETEVKMIGEFE